MVAKLLFLKSFGHYTKISPVLLKKISQYFGALVSRLLSLNQVFLPGLCSSRNLPFQQGDECEQCHSCTAEGIVKRIPVFAVFSVVVRDDILKVVSFLQFAIGARSTSFDLLQVPE